MKQVDLQVSDYYGTCKCQKKMHLSLHSIHLFKVNLPRALMIAIPMVTILYLLVNVSYLAAMTPREMMVSSAVAVTWG